MPSSGGINNIVNEMSNQINNMAANIANVSADEVADAVADGIESGIESGTKKIGKQKIKIKAEPEFEWDDPAVQKEVQRLEDKMSSFLERVNDETKNVTGDQVREFASAYTQIEKLTEKFGKKISKKYSKMMKDLSDPIIGKTIVGLDSSLAVKHARNNAETNWKRTLNTLESNRRLLQKESNTQMSYKDALKRPMTTDSKTEARRQLEDAYNEYQKYFGKNGSEFEKSVIDMSDAGRLAGISYAKALTEAYRQECKGIGKYVIDELKNETDAVKADPINILAKSETLGSIFNYAGQRKNREEQAEGFRDIVNSLPDKQRNSVKAYMSELRKMQKEGYDETQALFQALKLLANINDIKNKFTDLKDTFIPHNKASNAMLGVLTGMPTNTQDEINAAFRSLAPEQFDEAIRKSSEEAQAELDKQKNAFNEKWKEFAAAMLGENAFESMDNKAKGRVMSAFGKIVKSNDPLEGLKEVNRRFQGGELYDKTYKPKYVDDYIQGLRSQFPKADDLTSQLNEIDIEIDKYRKKEKELSDAIDKLNERSKELRHVTEDPYTAFGFTDRNKPIYDYAKLSDARTRLGKFDTQLPKRSEFNTRVDELFDIIQKDYLSQFGIENGAYKDFDDYMKNKTDLKFLYNLRNNENGIKGFKTKDIEAALRHVVMDLKESGSMTARAIGNGAYSIDSAMDQIDQQQSDVIHQMSELHDQLQETLHHIGELRDKRNELLFNSGSRSITTSPSNENIPLDKAEREFRETQQHASIAAVDISKAETEMGNSSEAAAQKVVRSQQEIQDEIDRTNKSIQNQKDWLREYSFIDKDYSTPEGSKKQAADQLRKAVKNLVLYRQNPKEYDPIKTDQELVMHRVNYAVLKATENAKTRGVSDRTLLQNKTDLTEFDEKRAIEYVNHSKEITLQILRNDEKRLEELQKELEESKRQETAIINNATIKQSSISKPKRSDDYEESLDSANQAYQSCTMSLYGYTEARQEANRVESQTPTSTSSGVQNNSEQIQENTEQLQRNTEERRKNMSLMERYEAEFGDVDAYYRKQHQESTQPSYDVTQALNNVVNQTHHIRPNNPETGEPQSFSTIDINYDKLLKEIIESDKEILYLEYKITHASDAEADPLRENLQIVKNRLDVYERLHAFMVANPEFEVDDGQTRVLQKQRDEARTIIENRLKARDAAAAQKDTDAERLELQNFILKNDKEIIKYERQLGDSGWDRETNQPLIDRIKLMTTINKLYEDEYNASASSAEKQNLTKLRADQASSMRSDYEIKDAQEKAKKKKAIADAQRKAQQAKDEAQRKQDEADRQAAYKYAEDVLREERKREAIYQSERQKAQQKDASDRERLKQAAIAEATNERTKALEELLKIQSKLNSETGTTETSKNNIANLKASRDHYKEINKENKDILINLGQQETVEKQNLDIHEKFTAQLKEQKAARIDAANAEKVTTAKQSAKEETRRLTSENERVAQSYKELTATVREYFDLKTKQVSGAQLTTQETTRLTDLENKWRAATEEAKGYVAVVGGSEKSVKAVSSAREGWLNKIDMEARGRIASVVGFDKQLSSWENSGKYTEKLVKDIKELRGELQDIAKNPLEILTPESLARLQKAEQVYEDISNKTKNADFKLAQADTIAKLNNQIEEYMSRNSAMGLQFKQRFEALKLDFDAAPTLAKAKEIVAEFAKLKSEVTMAGKTGASFFDTLKQRLIGVNAQLVAQLLSWHDIIRYIRTTASVVIELDTAMTELRKVSDASESRLVQSFEKSTQTAKELGSTITEVINKTSDWSRLGYEIGDAENLAKVTTLFQTVGDNMTSEDASSYIISSLQGFQMGADQAMEIVDKYNEVANNFAIDTRGIGEALQRSAASFNAANTSLSKSIALVTATNTVVQDPTSVGGQTRLR